MIEYLVHLPEFMSFEQGAALLLQGLTSLVLVKKSYPISRGDTVLVHVVIGNN